MIAAALACLLLLPARAFETGDLAQIGYYYQGVCPPDPLPSADVASGCFHGGTPSVDCRQENVLCPSTQVQAITLQSETRPGPCTAFTWKWYCTEEALVHCVDRLWCDPLALCNASAATCACQGNLVSQSHGRCGCEPTDYLARVDIPISNGAGQWTNYSCEPLTQCNATYPIETSAPTLTSDRACAAEETSTTKLTTLTTPPPPSVDTDHWYNVSIGVIIVLALIAAGVVGYSVRNYRRDGSVCPA